MGVAVTFGVGFTVITAVVVAPGQPLAVGVIVYVAVPDVVFAFVKDCAIGVPVLLLPPVIPAVCTTVHAYVVPATFDVKAMLGDWVLHIVCVPGVAVTLGVGFTVITAVVVDPGQPLALGVMVYVAVPAVVFPFVKT